MFQDTHIAKVIKLYCHFYVYQYKNRAETLYSYKHTGIFPAISEYDNKLLINHSRRRQFKCSNRNYNKQSSHENHLKSNIIEQPLYESLSSNILLSRYII